MDGLYKDMVVGVPLTVRGVIRKEYKGTMEMSMQSGQFDVVVLDRSEAAHGALTAAYADNQSKYSRQSGIDKGKHQSINVLV